MCDYSLYTIQNRLAEEGEELILHKFETGTLGFASASDFSRAGSLNTRSRYFLGQYEGLVGTAAYSTVHGDLRSSRNSLITERHSTNCADTPPHRPKEIALFTEVSDRSYSYRDALLPPNGTRVLLQDLPAGLHALVLSLSPGTAATL